MLEELFNLVKGVAGNAVVNNPEVPNDQNNAVMAEATNTVASGLRNIVAGGGLGSLVSLLKGSGNGNDDKSSLLSNPIVAMMVGHFAGKLMNKFNLGNNEANNVATSLIPGVISSLINKTNSSDAGGTFSIDNLLRSITGGQTEQVQQNSGTSITDLIGQLAGGNGHSNAGGLMDIVSQLAQGAQAQQQRNGGGGLLDLIKGFTQ
ncbi:MAG: hypothetical protein ABS68_00650 [Niastella sp. SCN 39-18]|nr:hypothetical protein [Sphingobacteriales bacterium]ODT55040.1 MAG: hypothetical protein ABS68_00650 [Niastella sp. SCN 39-18]OJW08483.1 MAG: hypothetical protein BGO53_13325 [Sphingobacteriales bacterium 39-19]